MPVDEPWIERYLSRWFTKSSNPEDPWRVEDEDLLVVVRSKLLEGLRSVNSIPETDPFWANTNREPTFSKLEDYCRSRLSLNPADDKALWHMFALDFHYGSNDLGTGHLIPLVAKDLRLLRWLVPATRHAEDSGLSGVECLKEAVSKLKSRIPDLEQQLQVLSQAPETNISRSALAALRALHGEDPFSESASRK